MSKKKGDVPPKSVLLGRVGTNLKCGIVGLPNVGKSTFFNVLTKSAVSAANFPFCTIDPNESRVTVPDPRFDWLCEYHNPVSRVPAYLNIVDIAGLVKGAHEGAGLGNAFLSHIKSVDALIHMLRVFSDPDVSHVEGDINPIRDLAIIEEELRLKDEEYVIAQWEKLEKAVVRGGDKKQKPDFDCITKAKELLCERKTGIRFGDWSPTEIEVLNHHLFLTAKPMIYLVNMSEKDYFRKKNKWLAPIKEWVDAHDPGATIIPFSADFELRFVEMSPEEQEALHKEMPGVTSALSKIIQTGYKTLQLIYFFTCGKDEVKAWTIQKNTKAPQAAGRIHSDMEKGFIMAEVMSFEDFKTEGSEAACKLAGKYRQKGREYVVQDGDIIFFKFNAGAGLQSKKK
uniref:Obg-like ATPase 1 n=1 Tax=Schistocephalus solidus TaxID=70667 RepID=A0A0X3NLK4_SCHSO